MLTQLTDPKAATNVTIHSEIGYRSNPINFDTQLSEQIPASNVGARFVGLKPSENINKATSWLGVQTVSSVEIPSRDINIQHVPS